ncbi:alcohol dehydrogenase catalytic domain-containing protein [Paenibacillus sp. LMG 31456]|uniref:Alcohol dehydrogenase catalytic domain-containing protein n=1 Tax=Paenibacillus foliorum TaxID=2654974 RepID=A0A972JZX7_9BACL|nr:NAD(P)-dependent alcohol dehydrogenase [Paenibacillus foliorum]NOU94056.1 alcohol dehydrogenase catalytic domain-containing protein [Paenibacillus foliorum]
MSETMMNAAVLEKPLTIAIKEVKRPAPGPYEALIKVYCIGVCGSDIHYYEHGKIGRYVVDRPIILGHELAGEVIQIGDKVTNVTIGDRVAVEPGVTCGRCNYCKSGRYNLCPEVIFMATPPVDGAWAEYVAIRSDFLFKLPEGMSYEEGALLEPLSVGFHAMKRGRVGPSDRVLILGLGPIGLLGIQAAKLFGVTEIIASDIVPFRREMALKLGATAVINPLEGNMSEQLSLLTGGDGIDVIIESSGNTQAISDTIRLVNRGGRIVYIGLPTAEQIPMDMNLLIDSELDVYGVFRYANTYPAAIQALKNSDIDLRHTITHKFALEDIQKAIDVATTQKDKSIKVMVYPIREDVERSNNN